MTKLKNIKLEGVLSELSATLNIYTPCHKEALQACFDRHNFGWSLPNFRELYHATLILITLMLRVEVWPARESLPLWR